MAAVFPECFGWVGGLGLGSMGRPMVTQLLRNTTAQLVVFDTNRAAVEQFVRDSPDGRVEIASSPREVADKATCILSFAADGIYTVVCEGSNQRLDLYLGRGFNEVYLTAETGLLAVKRSDKLFIDCSTVEVATSLAVGEVVEKSDPENPSRFYDCPVSGGKDAAAKGTLTFRAGMAADASDYPLIHKILSLMGIHIYPMGGKGLGLAARLINNYLSGIISLATAEAMNLGMKLGLDPKVLSDCFDQGSAANWVNSNVNPVPGVCPNSAPSKNYEGGLKVQVLEKDMKLAVEAAKQVEARLILGEIATGAYAAAASDPSFHGKDARVIYKWLGGVDPR
ncbi:6-phosphogluconate dehydrogenase [Mycena rebaudengoi]|nr:6-phosphogluconate dehydrogenase [Mycena rebaudengoi]